MPSIFLSYRRGDSQDVAGRIYDALVERFSRDCVFKDVDSIPLGRDFRAVLEKAVERATVVLALIGPGWSSAADADGRRRLDDPEDFVRLELELALERGKPVIPVLVGNAAMPRAEDLPPSLRGLAFQNGMPVRPDPDFHPDLARLAASLERLSSDWPRPAVLPPPVSSPGFFARYGAVLAALAAVLVVVIVFVADEGSATITKIESFQPKFPKYDPVTIPIDQPAVISDRPARREKERLDEKKGEEKPADWKNLLDSGKPTITFSDDKVIGIRTGKKIKKAGE